MIDYDEASGSYDNTRGIDEAVIEAMASRGVFGGAAAGRGDARGRAPGSPGPRVLDFGCGTGNYLRAIRARFGCELCGLEPSDEMRARAIAKNPGLRIEKGDHSRSPFEDGSLDFVYMTDVIHHVSDLDLLFEGLRAKLRPGGLACVATESRGKIAARWYNAYFPSLAAAEKARYPDIAEIAQRAMMAGLGSAGDDILDNPGPRKLDAEFLRMVGERNYSMFRLLPEEEYEAGYAAMRSDLGRTFLSPGAGQTLVWLEKGDAQWISASRR
jgi:SAM-dependent methyltransferase